MHGTNMWKDWQPDVVEADMKQISETGMQVIRVFPLWPDFQPIYQFYSGAGSLKEVRFKNGPLAVTGLGKAVVSTEALEHFRELADLPIPSFISLHYHSGHSYQVHAKFVRSLIKRNPTSPQLLSFASAMETQSNSTSFGLAI